MIIESGKSFFKYKNNHELDWSRYQVLINPAIAETIGISTKSFLAVCEKVKSIKFTSVENEFNFLSFIDLDIVRILAIKKLIEKGEPMELGIAYPFGLIIQNELFYWIKNNPEEILLDQLYYWLAFILSTRFEIDQNKIFRHKGKSLHLDQIVRIYKRCFSEIPNSDPFNFYEKAYKEKFGANVTNVLNTWLISESGIIEPYVQEIRKLYIRRDYWRDYSLDRITELPCEKSDNSQELWFRWYCTYLLYPFLNSVSTNFTFKEYQVGYTNNLTENELYLFLRISDYLKSGVLNCSRDELLSFIDLNFNSVSYINAQIFFQSNKSFNRYSSNTNLILFIGSKANLCEFVIEFIYIESNRKIKELAEITSRHFCLEQDVKLEMKSIYDNLRKYKPKDYLNPRIYIIPPL